MRKKCRHEESRVSQGSLSFVYQIYAGLGGLCMNKSVMIIINLGDYLGEDTEAQ